MQEHITRFIALIARINRVSAHSNHEALNTALGELHNLLDEEPQLTALVDICNDTLQVALRNYKDSLPKTFEQDLVAATQLVTFMDLDPDYEDSENYQIRLAKLRDILVRRPEIRNLIGIINLSSNSMITSILRDTA